MTDLTQFAHIGALNDEVLAIFKALDEAGIEAQHMALAGGAARDLHFRRPPKDLDFIILAKDEQAAYDAIDSLLAEGYVLIHDSAEVPENEEYGAPVSDFEQRWERHLKFSQAGHLPVDLLFALPKYADLRSVVQDFDFNINQFVVLYSLRRCLGPVFIGQDYKQLKRRRTCDQLTIERIEKMHDYAGLVGWKQGE